MNGFTICSECGETYWYEDCHPETGLCRYGVGEDGIFYPTFGGQATWDTGSKQWLFVVAPVDRFPMLRVGDPVPVLHPLVLDRR